MANSNLNTTCTNTNSSPAIASNHKSKSKPLTWLITGTSSGFGYRLALIALDRGDNVIATARSLVKLQKLVDEVSRDEEADPTKKERLRVCRFDLSDEEEVVRGMVKEASEMWGRIDVLVNNAGQLLRCVCRVFLLRYTRLGMARIIRRVGVCYAIRTPWVFELILNLESVSALQSIVDTNIIGTAKITFAVLPYMRARKSGTIVTIGSRSAWRAELPVMFLLILNTCPKTDMHDLEYRILCNGQSCSQRYLVLFQWSCKSSILTTLLT
jgi:NAD(P)-dependent dehydrogenase (short-subunit alcohol dehydrogenase family)